MIDGRTIFAQRKNNRNLFLKREFRIYRNYGLTIIQSKSPRTTENTSTALRKIFNKWSLKIAIEAGLIQIDFLDVHLNQ